MKGKLGRICEMNRDRVNRFAGSLVSIGYGTYEISGKYGQRYFAMHEGDRFNCRVGGYIIIYPNRISDDDLFLKVLKADIIVEAGKIVRIENHVMISESQLEELMASAYDIKLLSKAEYDLKELEKNE